MALTISNEELLFQWFVNPVEQRNNASLVFEIAGPLNVEQFLQACYHYLQQNINDRLSIDYAYRTEHSEITAESYVQLLAFDDHNLCIYDFIKQLVNRPYDLSSAAQPHLFLIQYSASHYYFVINTFHLEINNGLAEQLIRQIWSYSTDEEYVVSSEQPAESLPAEVYTDNHQVESARSYWREQLSGMDLFTPLPVKHVATARYHSHTFLWDSERVTLVNKIAEQLQLDSYQLLAAAYSTSLALLIGQSKLVLSARKLNLGDGPSHLSALPLCCDMRIGSMSQLVQSLASQYRNAQHHSALSFYDIIHDQQQLTGTNRCLNLDFAEAPLLEVELGADDLDITPLPMPWNTADDYDVSLQFDRNDNQEWLFRLTFNNQHLSDAEALWLQQNMARYLDALQLQLQDSVPTSSLCIHQMFQHTASLYPDTTALVDSDKLISYQQLDEITDQLAKLIRQHYFNTYKSSMPQETPVAIMLERSWYGVVAMLAVLKSGGCYVPVDPDFPEPRIDYILKDCQAPILISQYSVQHKCSASTASLLCIEDLLQQTPTHQDEVDALPQSATSLAYILYTSGTTGEPKGVMIEHRSALNTIHALKHLYGVPGYRIAAFTNFVFDVSVSEIFATLIYGNELHLLQNDIRQDAHNLSLYLNQNRINLVYLPPAILAIVPRINYPALHSIIFAGEPCDQTVGRYFAERFALYNYYGPTEASIYVTGKRVDSVDVNDIGYALPNMRSYVLDEAMQAVPDEEIGELYVSGIGLARGYLNKAEQTAARFIANPFATAAEHQQGFDRLYKTGDLVKHTAQGSLKYLGRNDFQVKIHGFRVELGEIEAALSTIEEIGQSLVLVKERNELKRLVAYYQALAPIDEKRLRVQLAERLPSYMLPHYFVGLQSFPLTTNGKIDRQRLPEPEWLQQVGAVPKNQREQLILTLWQQVLGSDQFGVTDDFFQIGGDSLAAMRVALLLQQQQLDCSTKLLYQHNTVRKLATQLVPLQQPSQQIIASDSTELNEMQRLVLNHQLITSPVLYNENITIDFHGMRLTEQQLSHALMRFINHHASMRMKVLEDYQSFAVTESLEHGPEIHTEYFTAAEFDQKYKASLKHWVNLPFALLRGPLYRFVLFYRDNQPVKLAFIHHHLISDGDAMYNLFVPQLYALLKDGNSALAPYPTTISRPLPRSDLSALIQSMHRVDLFNSRPSVDCQGNYLCTNFSETQTKQLETLARQHNVSLYAVLQSLIAVLVWKFSGQRQMSIGGVKSLRGPDAEAVYGNFLANDISNCHIDATEPFIDLVKQRFADIQQDLDQIIPYQQLLEALRHENTLDEKLPGIYMTLEPKSKVQLLWQVTQNDTLPHSVKYPLYFEFDHQQQLLLRLEYRSAMYTKTQAQQLITALQLLTEQCLQHPETKIHQLQVMPTQQIQQLLHPFQIVQDMEHHQQNQTLVQMFERSVQQFPDNVALNFGAEAWTYRQLDNKANQLAHLIRQRTNVEADTLIALLLPRSLDTVLAILAVLKAGAAYVPIDSSYPEDRVSFILQDTQAALLLTHRNYSDLSGEFSGDTLFLDENIGQEHSTTAPDVSIDPHQLAYVIYTSGSTGKPKGVLLEHHNVCRLLSSTQADYQFNQQDVWCLFHSYVFDFSVWEIWGAFAYGGRLFVPTKEQAQDTETFVALCQQQQLTVLNQTPSAFYNFSDRALLLPRIKSLRYVIFGGEALNLNQLSSWFDYYGDKQPLLVNMYGITETTVHVTYKALQQNDISDQSTIGKPLSDLQVYLLDDYLEPVPMGVTAELYVSGPGLARGYLNRPELNNERFIRNPYDRPGHEVLYKSGDLVCLTEQGELEYIGRIDNQVKIRGYRIELGEIESALSAYPTVRQSLVITKDTQNSKVLVAYYLADSALDHHKLSAALAAKLPPHMVPVHYIHVTEFKLTVNGKLDKKALPQPDFSSQHYIAPQNEQEQQACLIWQEVLGVEKVGMQDDFFQIGGDSINSIRVVARLKELRLDISVRDIFEHRTLAALFRNAGKYSAEQTTYEAFELVEPVLLNQLSIDLSSLEDAYPATWLQQGMFVESDKNQQVYHNIEVNHIPAAFEMETFVQIWQQLIQKHELLRASYLKQDGPGYLTLIHKLVSCEDKIVFYDKYTEAYQQELATPLPINNAGLFRLAIVRESDAFQLLFTSHHSIEDGWSVASLLSEFIQAYVNHQAIQKDHELLFAHYVKQEVEALKDQTHSRFWQDYLADYSMPTVQFTERQQQANSPMLLESTLTLEPELSQALSQLAFQQSVSVDTVYLSAYLYLLSVFFNQEDITVGLVVNNRLELDGGDQQFGLHLNTIPLRMQLTDSTNLLKQTHRQRLKLLRHKIYPYGKIKADLALQQDIYQAAFNYIHFYQKHATLEKSGSEMLDVLAITNIPLALVVSRQSDSFDIAFQGHSSFIDQSYLELMKAHYVDYLEQLAKQHHINQRLTVAHQQQVLLEHNQTERTLAHQDLMQWWYQSTTQHASRTAVSDPNRNLTYEQLNAESNQLAHELQKRLPEFTVGQPTPLIAIMMDRSADMLVAILAVLKAGAAYVPVDPAYPPQRIRYMLQDSKAVFVLTQRQLLSSATTLSELDLAVYYMDEQQHLTAPKSNPKVPENQHRLANVIYTSGTTGRPKGVMIPQAAIVNLASAQHQLLDLVKEDKVLQFASFSFDAATWEIFATLLQGSTLVICPNAYKENVGALLSLLEQEQISVATLPPALLNVMDAALLPKLRLLVVAGEATPLATMQRWSKGRRLINAYGPTETTVCTSLHVYQDGDLATTIGKPLANLKCYVLDAHLQPVPCGVPGELYVSGAGVAAGYLHQTELSSQRFIANPYGKNLGSAHQRLYRTGDSVRRLLNGDLDYLGRVDHQVKIRGNRVELAEIEAVLTEFPAIKQATAIIREREGQSYIAAYFTSQSLGQSDDVSLVADWNKIYESEYGKKSADDFNPADFDGWNSSYDGKPIAHESMLEWRDETLERILQLKPKRILEIGSGAGLLFYPLLPHCDHYFATDFSAEALAKLKFGATVLDVEHKTQFALCDAASIAETVGDYQPDLIIINSVIQYFPSCEYLLEVCQQAMTLLNGQGQLFIGDIRDARLLDIMHYDIQKYLQPDASFTSLVEATKQARVQDKELLVCPDFFLRFAQEFKDRNGEGKNHIPIDLLLKAGRYSNEMLNYRYDVIVDCSTGAAPQALAQVETEFHFSADFAVEQCCQQNLTSFVIRNYPNSRVYQNYIEFHNLPSRLAANQLLSYQQLADIANTYGYQFKASVQPDDPALLTLIFQRIDQPSSSLHAQLVSSQLVSARPRPLAYAVREPLIPLNTKELRSYLEQRLPAFMLPNMLVQLEAMPLTPNGKLDRNALPEPEQDQRNYVAPRNELEQALCLIWQDILGITRVGVHDDFFQLGGNSILAISLSHRISIVLQREVSLASLFRHKTIAQLTEHGLSKEAVLIEPATEAEKPLSYAQNRLWFLQQYEQDSSAYHIPLLLKLNASDTTWLPPALHAILERHQVLRSVYQQLDDTTELQLKNASDLSIEQHDCASLEFDPLLQEQINRPFDLNQQLPIRASLIDTEQDHYLLLVIHHIAFDGWSVDLLLNELTMYQQHYVSEQPLQLPELPVQYSDFAIWQRQFLAEDELERQLDYWQQQLQGFEPLQLPESNPRPKAFDYKGENLQLTLTNDLSLQLKKLARQQQITLNSLLLAAFNLLLSKYCNQNDIVVGCPVANRHYQGTEALMGFFVNALAVRNQINPEQHFNAFAMAVHQGIVAAQGHQDVPFELIVDRMQVERDSSRHPIFQVMFSVQSFGQTQQQWCELQSVDQLYPVAKHDLTCFVTEHQHHLTLDLNYASSLFSPDFIAQMAESFQSILLQLLQQPEAKLSSFEVISETQRHWLLYENNQHQQQLEFGHLAEYWRHSVANKGTESALRCNGITLSYQQLDQLSDQLAGFIHDQQYLSEQPVIAIVLDRSIELFVSLLASIKLGAAYLPIDSATPADRIAFMVEDSQADLVISSQTLCNLIPRQLQVLDLSLLELSALPVEAPTVKPSPQDPAYIIYTSGTTGLPKGVLITHRSVVNYIANVGNGNMPQGSVVDFSSSIAFDLSVTTTLVPLMLGCEIVIFTETLKDLDAYRQHLLTERVTFAKLVPSLAEQVFLDDNRIHLTTLMVGGEKLKLQQKSLLLQNCDRLLDEYGPTETTVGACLADVAEDQGIGRAYANYKLYVLDAAQKPVPVGVWGELYIAGFGVASGYLNRPELTAERFVTNPFDSNSDYQRLYRTGDTVRWLPSGELEYLARNDNQVKLRGYRIECGEVEAAVEQLEQVQQSVVVLKQVGQQPALVAYYVAAEKLDEDLLRDTVAGFLPDYMQPAYYQWMSALPLTNNGKLDHKQLPDPEIQQQQFEQAEDPLEQQLLSIWQPLLAVEKLGVHDDFFRSGGDSILSIQLVSRLRKAGLSLSVKDLFEHRTVRTLARHLQSVTTARPGVEPGLAQGQFGLLPIQQNFFRQLEQGQISQPNHWNQSFFIAVPKLEIKPLQQAWAALIQRHDILRCVFVFDQGQWQHEYRAQPVPEVQLIDARTFDENELAQQLTNLQQSLNIETGPLYGLAYLIDSEQQGRIFIYCHHLLIDVVSWRILLEDLHALYQGKAAAQSTSSYQQWVSYVDSYPALFAGERSYWQNTAQQQIDYSTLAVMQPDTGKHCQRIEFSAELTHQLLKQANKAYDTEINDLLLTALARALQQLFELPSVTVSLEGHGRQPQDNQLDLSHSIGWFTSQYPVNLQAADEPGLAIRQIKQQLRQVPNKGLGFGAFAEQLQLHLPAIQFNYLGVLNADDSDEWVIQLDELSCGIAPSNQQSWLLDINGAVEHGRLFFDVSSNLCTAQSNQFASLFEQQITALTGHCVALPDAGSREKTPADFGVPLTLEYYDQLMQQHQLDAIYSATSLQKGFLSHALMHPDDDAYRVQFVIDYYQQLDVSLYRQAWQLAVQSFPALRTSFDWTEHPVQLVHSSAQLELVELDYSQSDNAEQQVQELQQQDRKRAFDLRQPCLLRLYLIKLSEDHYCLLRSEHHSISDGWSGPQLMKTVHGFYQALLSGNKPSVINQQSYLQAQSYYHYHQQSCQAYWQQQLAEMTTVNDLSPLFDLPFTRKEAEQHLVTQAGQVFCQTSVSAFAGLTQQHGITLSTLLQFVWHKLITSYTFAPQTLAGTTISGRALPIEGIEESVGLYINTLPLLVNWDNSNTVLQQLQQISKAINSMNHFSFADLADLQRGRGSLFQSIVVFENYPSAEEQQDIQYQYREAFEKVNYPLVLVAYQQGDSLHYGLKYDATHLSDRGASQLLSQLNSLLTELPEALLRPHSELCIKQASTESWCLEGPSRTLPATDVIQWFEKTVDLYPEHKAIYFEGDYLSYRQLQQLSDQLAGKLITQLRPDPDAVIALCLHKSAAMIVAMLAVMKAGAAYLPIAPDAPEERTAFMLSDSKALLVLTDADTQQSISTLSPCPTIVLNLQKMQSEAEATTANKPSWTLASNQLAYLIYTSGTTGQPKAVMTEHQGLINITQSQQLLLAHQPGDKVLQFSNYVFDASVFEIFPVLTSGACLYVLPQPLQNDVTGLVDYLCTHQIITAFISTAVIKHLHGLERTKLQQLYTGGESLDGLQQLPPCTLWNQYGPTETSVCATQSQVLDVDNIAIGRPVQNMRAYLLDQWGLPAVPGAIAELCLSGIGLARGYLGKIELTAEKFTSNPYSAEPGFERLYHSGDLVRLGTDGQMYYVGRRDQQVKIRGYRVELAEIEHAILQHPAVEQVLVMQRQQDEQLLLVAYYLSRQQADSKTLQSHLKPLLPDYMQPQAWVLLEKMPLAASGKIDRSALPDAEFVTGSVKASTETERKLAQLWQQSLGVREPGIEDDFYQLGGDSILAISLSQQIASAFNCQLSVSDFIRAKTIAAIAQIIDQQILQQTSFDSGEI
ncbi:hypothetical protein CWE22_03755 [Pseudidiomarina aestuarii]|uniref:Carrier domain-containing protein n=1 Tax=Pseudidiomarina aestuarii TaxID=624146 RepID=A0A7Z7ETN8_9GAMM|nr:non-ribosomal peptide synthetase [Pseudidiomarina aestuarii]RUO41303.1 hypothetical protein CWE22_03755 [Pseudidiomarina aestuarii]